MIRPDSTKVCIVAAISRQRRALGKENRLLWHIPEDLKRFRELTKGHPVIMGRKTFESIISYLGKPLPDRTNIVVTRNPLFSYPEVIVANSIHDAIESARVLDTEEVHVIGGADIYRQALPFTDRLYLTLIDDELGADAFFPEYEKEFTKKVATEERTTKDGLKYEWVTLERK